jgi:hypothetical protein
LFLARRSALDTETGGLPATDRTLLILSASFQPSSSTAVTMRASGLKARQMMFAIMPVEESQPYANLDAYLQCFSRCGV